MTSSARTFEALKRFHTLWTLYLKIICICSHIVVKNYNEGRKIDTKIIDIFFENDFILQCNKLTTFHNSMPMRVMVRPALVISLLIQLKEDKHLTNLNKQLQLLDKSIFKDELMTNYVSVIIEIEGMKELGNNNFDT